jgi:hypothetical protein
MAWSWYRWKVGRTGCATCSNSGSAVSRCRRDGGQSWCRAGLSEIAISRQGRWSHGRLGFGRPRNLRPRQGSPTSVCALEEAEPAHPALTGTGTGFLGAGG